MKSKNHSDVSFELPQENPLRLISYLKKYKKYFWIQTAGGIIYNTVIVAGPVLLGKMIDTAGQLVTNGVTPERVRTLLLYVVSFFLVTALFQYGRYVKRWYLRIMTNRMSSDMRAGLLSKVLCYPMAEIEKESVGDLMSRTVGDVDQINNTLQQTINEGWDTGLLMISYFVVLIYYDWHITLLASIPIPFAIVLAELVRHPVYRYSMNSRRAAAVVASHVQRTIEGLNILRLFGREEVEADRLKDFSRNQMRWDIKTGLLQNAMMPLYAALASLGLVFVIIMGGDRVVAGTWTVGTFVAYLSMFGLMAARTQVAARIFNQFHAASASWDRIRAKLGESEPINEMVTKKIENSTAIFQELPSRPLIKVKYLSFKYPQSERQVLTDISFTVNQGDFVGITGPVGSGKSALATVLTGLYPYSGEISISGKSLRDMALDERANTFAYSGEEGFLFSASIRQNITFKDEIDSVEEGELLDESVHIAALSDDMELFPQGMDTIIGERGVRLSGGQRQRVSLARAVYSGNPILLFDDPFSAVDIGTEQRMIERIRESLKDSTILVFSHRLASFADASLIIVLDKGKVVEQGDHQTLIAKKGVYQKIYSAQTWIESETNES